MRHGIREYSRTPLNIYWEMTQACALACRHCRAESMPSPHPDQLSFQETLAFLRQFPDLGVPLPHVIHPGGDPIQRQVLYLLIDEARKRGRGVSFTPAATPALRRETLARLKEHG